MLILLTALALAADCADLDQTLTDNVLARATAGRFVEPATHGVIEAAGSGSWAAWTLPSQVYVFHRSGRGARSTRIEGQHPVQFVHFVGEEWLAIGWSLPHDGLVAPTRVDLYRLGGRPVPTDTFGLPGRVVEVDDRDGELVFALQADLGLTRQEIYGSDEPERRMARMRRALDDARGGRRLTDVVLGGVDGSALVDCEDVARTDTEDTTLLSIVRLSPERPRQSVRAAAVLTRGTTARAHFHGDRATVVTGTPLRAVRFDLDGPSFAWDTAIATRSRVDLDSGVYYGASNVAADGAVWVASRPGHGFEGLTLTRIDDDGTATTELEQGFGVYRGFVAPMGHGFAIVDDRVQFFDTADPTAVHQLPVVAVRGRPLTGDSYLVWHSVGGSSGVVGWTLSEWDGRALQPTPIRDFPPQAGLGHARWVGGVLDLPFDERFLSVVVGGPGYAEILGFERQDGALQYRWTQPFQGHHVRVAGGLVIYLDDDRVVALDARTGRKLGSARFD